VSLRITAVIADFRKQMAREIRAGEIAVHGGVVEATDTLKKRLRFMTTSAGLGVRISRTWRSKVKPDTPAKMTADGLVWSKVPHIMRTHAFGATIRARNVKWMTIPTPIAGKGKRGGRITPREWEAKTGRKLRFVPAARGRPPMLVTDHSTGGRLKSGAARISRAASPRVAKTEVIFILRRVVKLEKVMDVERAAAMEVARIPEYVKKRWKKAA